MNQPVTKPFGRRLLPFALLGFTLVLLVLGFQWYKRSGQEKPLEQFEAMMAANRLDEAGQVVAGRFAANPADPLGHYLQAWLELTRDRPEEAMNAMRNAKSKGFPEDDVLVLRAVLLARAGKFPEAAPILEKAYVSGGHPKALILESLARIYLGTMQLAKASSALEAWRAAAPLDDRPYLWRNEIDERVDSEPDALISNYREALKRNSMNLKARLALADVLMRANRREESFEEYQACLAQDNGNVEAWLGLGKIAVLKGDAGAAESSFKKVLEQKPDEFTALAELGQLEIGKANFVAACEYLKKAVALMPGDAEILYKYSQALKLAGRLEESRSMATKASALRSDQDKIQEMRKTLVQQPDNVELRLEASKWLIEHGHEKEGLEWVALILKQKPGHQATCRFMADYYEKKQDFGLANYYKSLISAK